MVLSIVMNPKLLTSSLEVASKVADERFELHKTMSRGIVAVLRWPSAVRWSFVLQRENSNENDV